MKALKSFIIFSFLLIQSVAIQSDPLPTLTEHALGKANAPVLIIEYSSLSCSHCADFHTKILPQIQKKYVLPGHVKIIFRDFVSDRQSLQAHQLARCMGNKYHDTLNYLFQNQNQWLVAKNSTEELKKIAIKKGMSPKQFDNCMQNNTLVYQLISLRQEGEKAYKITSTPTLIINGKIYPYALTFKDFEKILNPLLAKSTLKKD